MAEEVAEGGDRGGGGGEEEEAAKEEVETGGVAEMEEGEEEEAGFRGAKVAALKGAGDPRDSVTPLAITRGVEEAVKDGERVGEGEVRGVGEDGKRKEVGTARSGEIRGEGRRQGAQLLKRGSLASRCIPWEEPPTAAAAFCNPSLPLLLLPATRTRMSF